MKGPGDVPDALSFLSEKTENDRARRVQVLFYRKDRAYNMAMETISFENMELDARLLRAVKEMGFEEASPIQTQAIPAATEGRDLIGQAQTGTGKTAAFGLPLLERIDPEVKKVQALVLLPTRELAMQVAEEFRRFAKFMHGVKILAVYGGQEMGKQIRALHGVNVVVGTPGRVMDHMRRHTIKTEWIHTVVLDEADEMLNMGFLEDMETILSQLPEERQTMMFSATMPPAIVEISQRFLKEPMMVQVAKKELTVPKITQYYYQVSQENKAEVMSRLLDMYTPKLSIVFCNKKRQVDELARELQERGYLAEGLHGDLKQEQRDQVMNRFRQGRTNILVATDVAARGIDVGAVEAVFNYDIPQDDEYYVHRIGRTGRAGREGMAFSFAAGRELYKLRDIQRYCKAVMIPQAVPTLAELTKIRAERILDQAEKAREAEANRADAADMAAESEAGLSELVERACATLGCSGSDLAAALLRLALGEQKEDGIESYCLPCPLDELGRRSRSGRETGRRGRGGRGADWRSRGGRSMDWNSCDERSVDWRDRGPDWRSRGERNAGRRSRDRRETAGRRMPVKREKKAV